MSMRLRVPALILSMSALLAGCSTDTQHTSNSLSANATLAPGGDSNVVTVNPSIHGGTWQGWGTSLAWFAYVIGGAPNGVRNHIADLLFSQQKGLGLNVLRYNIGGGENPNLHFLQPRAKIPGYEPTEGNYNWTADASQRWMLQAAKKRGANVFEAFSNSPPYWMTKSDSVTGAKGGGDNLRPQDYKAFASYLAQVLKHFRNDWGINFTTVEPFNEPVSNWWNYGGTQEGDHFDNASQAAFIPILYKALKSQGLTTGIAAPDDNSIDETLNSWDSYSDNVKNDISQINTHSYNGSERVELNNASKKEGKHLWMSEYGDGDATGMTMSTQIIADIKQMQPTAWVYWQAVDGPGWGMLQMNVNHPGDWTFVKTEKYYVMENYSKFIRPGYQFVDINLPNAVAAYNASNRRLVIVTTNASSNNESFTYELDKFNKTPTDVEVYRTSEEEHLRELKPITVRDKEFEAIAKANSVTTYVITNIRN